MSKITIRLMGGLANQMFQYAAALALAGRRGAELVVNTTSYREAPADRQYLLHVFSIPERVENGPSAADRTPRLLTGSRAGRAALGTLAGLGIGTGIYRERQFHFDPAVLELDAPCELRGYFHTARYFEGYEPLVRSRFANLPPLSPAAQAAAARIAAADAAVGIHVRGGDYLRQSGSAPLRPLSGRYYERALSVLSRMADARLTHFVFTDDPDHARSVLPAGAGDYHFVETQVERPWEDMWLLARCRHMIMANSSFSWWAAWLNDADGKIIIAPRNWFTDAGMRTRNVCDVYQDGWLLL